MAFFVCLAGILGAASARPMPVQELVRLVEGRYRSAETLETQFLERYSENGRLVRVESGKAYFRRPGKMRWEYESPESKMFLSDGKKVWFYVPSDHTVMRSAVKDSSDWRTPFLLLVRKPRFSDLCKGIALGQPGEALSGDAVIHCSPRSAGAGDEILFEVKSSTGDLTRVLIREAGGVEIDFRFGEWVRNPALAAMTFEFRPPMGTAIVDSEPPLK